MTTNSKPVTRDELVAFLDESEDTLTREEVREAILAAWDFAMFQVPGADVGEHAEDAAWERFRAVTR